MPPPAWRCPLDPPQGRLAAPAPPAPSRAGVLPRVGSLAGSLPTPGPAAPLAGLTQPGPSVSPHGQALRLLSSLCACSSDTS